MSVESAGRVIDPMTEDEARRLTTEALSEFRSAVSHHERGWQIVAQAIRAGGHEALGYLSASDYLEHEFAQTLAGLDVSARRVAVRELTNLGMSTRAIAPVVGVTQMTVVRDVQQVKHDVSPEPNVVSIAPVPEAWPPRPVERIDMETGEVLAEPRIIGRDGKTYMRQRETPAETAARVIAEKQPSKPQRRPITDTFWAGVYDLTKQADSLRRLADDERFIRNREALAQKNQHEIQRAISTLSEVLTALQSNNHN